MENYFWFNWFDWNYYNDLYKTVCCRLCQIQKLKIRKVLNLHFLKPGSVVNNITDNNRHRGLFAWISYIAPMMTEVAHFSARSVPYIMMLAGFGMVVGNFGRW